MAESPRDEIAKLESMYQANPEGRVFTHLAEAYRKAGDLARAREVLEDGLRRHADSASGYVVLGRVMQDMGQPQESAAAFQRVLELDPENRVALRALGELAQAEGRTEQALGLFRQLQALDPSDESVEALIVEASAAPPRPAPVKEAPVSEEPAPEVSLPPFAPQEADAEPPAEAEPSGFELSAFEVSTFSDAETPPDGTAGADAESEPFGAIDWGAVSLPQGGDLTGAGDQIAEAAGEEPSLPSFGALEGLETVGEAGLSSGGEPPAPVQPLAELVQEGGEGPEPYPPIDQVWGLEPSEPGLEPGAGEPTEMVTETMADLYRSQGHLLRAAEIYRTLLRDRPGDEQLERKLLEVELAILSPSAQAPGESAAASDAAPEWGGPGAEADFLAPPAEPGAAAGTAAEGVEFAAELQGVEAGAGEPVPGEEASREAGPAAEAGAPQEAPAPAEEAQPGAQPEPQVGEVGVPAPVPAWAEAEPLAEAAAEGAAEGLGAPVAEGGELAAAEAEREAPAEEPAAGEEAAEPVPAVPAMEAVWAGAEAVGAGAATPYAWESQAPEEESGPPVALYLRTLLGWRRNTAPAAAAAAESGPAAGAVAAPEAAAPAEEQPGTAPQAEAPPPAWEPEASAAPAREPETPPPAPAWESEAPAPPPAWEQPQVPPAAPPAWEPEAPAASSGWEPESAAEPWSPPAAPPPAEPSWAEPPAAEPWEPAAAESASPASPPADSGEDMSWLLGPEGAAPAGGEETRGEAQETPASPGDDDDLEMFRAWLQSLKK